MGEEATAHLPRFVINLMTPRSLAPGLVREGGDLFRLQIQAAL